MSTVPLQPAFIWTCPDCSRENYERCIVPPFDSEEDEQCARDILGLAAGDEFSVVPPQFVVCRRCNHEFQTDVLYTHELGAEVCRRA